jgi:hypothetical protein
MGKTVGSDFHDRLLGESFPLGAIGNKNKEIIILRVGALSYSLYERISTCRLRGRPDGATSKSAHPSCPGSGKTWNGRGKPPAWIAKKTEALSRSKVGLGKAAVAGLLSSTVAWSLVSCDIGVRWERRSQQVKRDSLLDRVQRK